MSRIRATLNAMPNLFIPFFLRKGFVYPAADFRKDLFAGLTVAVIQIPQSMAFAIIAGLPAVYGLYASLPGFLASIFGSSKQLSTGPVAVVSLLTFTSLVPFADPGTPEYIGLAALLALLVGLMYLLMGSLRLGFVMRLIPQSVIVGFSSAAAAIIVVTQIPTVLGLAASQHDLVLQNIKDLLVGLPHLSLFTIIVGIATAFLLTASRRFSAIFPAAFLALVVGIAAGYFLHLGGYGIALVAAVPSSLPSFSFPFLQAVPFLLLIPKAAIIALVGFVGAHATAKAVAAKDKQPVDIDQELVGQGLANLIAGFFRGFPLSGSFTRTALNVEAGARTGFAAVVATCVTIVALLFFTPFFSYLPRSVLAVIVIVSALPLINIERLRETYRISRTDGYVAYLTFAIAFLLKADDAIFIGVVAALMLFIRQTISGAHVHEMGADREWNVLRSSIEEDKVETYKTVCIGRIAMSLYYANVTHVIHQIDSLLDRNASREEAPVRTLVLDMSGVHFIDITAMETFVEYLEGLKSRGIAIAFIYLRKAVREALERLPDLIEITLLHNISELKQFCLPDNASKLWLSGSQPEKLGKRRA